MFSALSHINCKLTHTLNRIHLYSITNTLFLRLLLFSATPKKTVVKRRRKTYLLQQHMHKANKELSCHQQNKHHMQRKTNPYLMFQVPVFWNVSKNWHYWRLQIVRFRYSNLSLRCIYRKPCCLLLLPDTCSRPGSPGLRQGLLCKPCCALLPAHWSRRPAPSRPGKAPCCQLHCAFQQWHGNLVHWTLQAF